MAFYGSPAWSTTTKAIVASVVLLLTALLFWRFRDLLPMLITAGLMAYLLHPLVSTVDRRTRLTRPQVVLLVYLLFAAIFVAATVAVGVIALEQVIILSKRLPDWFAQTVAFLGSLPDLLPALITIGPYSFELSPLRDQVREQFDLLLNANALYTQILALVEPIFSRGGFLAASLVQTTVSFIGLALTVFILSIYMANDFPRLGGLISDLAHETGYRQDAERLMMETSRIWSAYFRGQVILGIVIFFVVSITLSILGVNNALGLGLLSGVMEFLPIIGPVIGTGAAVLVALFQGANGWDLSAINFALLVAAAMFLIQQLENSVLVPRIVGDALDLHPLLVMVSVIMGATLAGLLGAVLAAPVVATIKLLGGYAWRKMFDLPPFPIDVDVEPVLTAAETRRSGIGRYSPQAISRLISRRFLGAADDDSAGKRPMVDESTHKHESVAVPGDAGAAVVDDGSPFPQQSTRRGRLMSDAIYPLQFEPIFKDYPWGGRNLQTKLGRSIPEGTVAESWEISAHPNGQTTVRGGPLDGQTLGEVQRTLGALLVGRRNRRALELDKFPLLIKLLDANQWLSVQVHPDDAYALAHENDYGKTEMWVVLHAEPNAELIYGLKEGVDRAAFASAVAENRSQELLHRVKADVGDVIFVPAGAVHSLGPGLLVAEIQQNSDTTYRIYDWERMGNDGQPRALHIEQALDVIDWEIVEPDVMSPQAVADSAPGVRREVIGHCSYFRTDRFSLDAGARHDDTCLGESFHIWAVLAGAATLHWRGESLVLEAVSWVLLPAALGAYQIESADGATLLRVTTPAAGDEKR